MFSIFSNHFFNWILQLKDSHHEIYWLDISSSSHCVEKIDFVKQIVNWKKKFSYPGDYWIKKYFPNLHTHIKGFNNRELAIMFQQKLEEIQPDVVHSFHMFSACFPVLDIMKNYPTIKWIYSPWGSDLFFYKNDPVRGIKIKNTLPHIDYMFADCNRDYDIAVNNGFEGKYLGTYPGGGGYDINSLNESIIPTEGRNVILIKGYQNIFGRCNNVLEAMLKIPDSINQFNIIIFGAENDVFELLNEPRFATLKKIKIYGRVGRGKVLEFMGKSLIYIGNSISDGIPNTLLEAIIMGAFPIQSNPGGATAEIIENGKNGLLIQDPEDSDEIAHLLTKVIHNPSMVKRGITFNSQNLKPLFERNFVKGQVLEKYNLIEKELLQYHSK